MGSFTVLLAALIFTGGSAYGSEIETVKAIIGIHQLDARRMLGREIALTIYETDEAPNAHASYRGPNGGPIITYFSTLLTEQYDDDVVTVVCHELGHFLGSRMPGKTAGGFAIEGEADYFAGKCSVRYYRMIHGMSLSQAQAATAETAQKMFQNLYKIRINPNMAKQQQNMGVNQSYSPPPCRVLTVIHGAMDWKRPACWYNP